MAHFSRRHDTYRALNNELTPPLASLAEHGNAAPTMITLDHEHEDATNVIIHKVPKTKGKHCQNDYSCLCLSYYICYLLVYLLYFHKILQKPKSIVLFGLGVNNIFLKNFMGLEEPF